MTISKPEIFGGTIEFTQEADCCADNQLDQSIKVSVTNGGGGKYFYIETERWAFNDIDELIAILNRAKKFLAEEPVSPTPKSDA